MENQEVFNTIRKKFDELIIFRTLKQNPLIREILTGVNNEGEAVSFNAWYGSLLEKYPETENCWSEYLHHAIVNDENYFALQCEQGNFALMSPHIRDAVERDIQTLLQILQWNPAEAISGQSRPGKRLTDVPENDRSTETNNHLNHLATHYTQKGAGIFGKYATFSWQAVSHSFKPVAKPDPITFENLIGYHYQQQTILQNTRQFLKGLPANNILLYGDRGTGKSSSVKALVNTFANQGLRVIEVNKEDLGDFPVIAEKLSVRGLKFIIYVDDLSFEGGETQYKHLKAILEGGLEIKPANVLIYATSNRRHLIKESFIDRDNDLHGNDTVQEQLSLADRFGISLTFSTPDQEEYLAIVRNLALQRGLAIEINLLEARALQWERVHNGRSGRTARQFIDQLEGELRLINN